MREQVQICHILEHVYNIQNTGIISGNIFRKFTYMQTQLTNNTALRK